MEKQFISEEDLLLDSYRLGDWLVLPYELNGLTRDEIYRNKPFLKPILEGLAGQPPHDGE